MSIKMVVTDLDGTLFNHQEVVSDTNRLAFQRIITQGILPVVATGRMKSEARYAFDAIGASRYFMGMNGCRTVDMQQQKIVYEHFLARSLFDEILQKLTELDVFFQMYTSEGVKCLPHLHPRMAQSGMAPAYLARFGDEILPAGLQQLAHLNIYKFLVVDTDSGKLEALRQAFANNPDVSLVASQLYYVEIISARVNKGVALQRLCDHLGISTASVMAIGDSENDIEMLRLVGAGVAMGNAASHVKAAARYVAPSNDDDGVSLGAE